MLPDVGIYCTLGIFSKPMAKIILPNFAHIFRQIFVKLSKAFILPVKSVLGYFYRHLPTFYWSHWQAILVNLGLIPVQKIERLFREIGQKQTSVANPINIFRS